MEYVTFDPENGDLALHLPDRYLAFQEELCAHLAENFMQAEVNDDALKQMNAFVAAWIQQHAS